MMLLHATDRRTHTTSIVISNTCLCNGVHLVQVARWPKSLSDSSSMLQERLLLKGGFSRARLIVLGTGTSQKVVILEPELFRLQTRWETFYQKCTQLCHSMAKWQGNRHVDRTKINCVMRMHDCHRILKPSKAPHLWNKLCNADPSE